MFKMFFTGISMMLMFATGVVAQQYNNSIVAPRRITTPQQQSVVSSRSYAPARPYAPATAPANGGNAYSIGCDSGCGTACGSGRAPACDSGCATGGCGSSCASGCDSGGGMGQRLGQGLLGNRGNGNCNGQSNCCCGCCCEPTKYFGIFGGWSDARDLVSTVGPLIGNVSLDLQANDGWLIGGKFGKRRGTSIRTEREFAWRNVTIGSLSALPAIGPTPVDDQVNVYSSTFNVYYDFLRRMNPDTPITPYIGGGVGIALVDQQIGIPGIPIDLRNEFGAVAYQGIIGANFRLPRNAQFFVEYRYFATTESKLTITDPGTGAFAQAQAGFESNNVVFGFNFWR